MITELDTAVAKIKSRNISGSHFPQCPFLKRALAPEIHGVSLHFTGACLVTADQGHPVLILRWAHWILWCLLDRMDF